MKPEGKRHQGRLREKWLGVVEEDFEALGVQE